MIILLWLFTREESDHRFNFRETSVSTYENNDGHGKISGVIEIGLFEYGNIFEF